ncbi:MAG: lecithin--cholesterol acyltransferase [Alkalinema sp. RU_4_3]|nr:lecithin--cholesterol acyltransferase [Alkalinema sp. RU_4_3]
MASKIPMGDMVVILPGIMGSVLQKDGKDLWAISGTALWDGLLDREGFAERLQLKEDDPIAADLGDGIKAVRLFEDAMIVPGFMKIDGYTQTAQMITQNFDVVEGDIYRDAWDKPANFYRFPYDWRRDNRANARILKDLLDRRLACWRSRSGNPQAKLIRDGPQYGGLGCARYYLEVLGGWRDAKALFTFGTPYRGALVAVDSLSNDYKKRFLDLRAAMRSMTSIYQLLPIYEVIKIGDRYHRVAEVEKLPNIDRAKAQNALAFHREIETAVTENLKDPAYAGFSTMPIVGIQQETYQSAELVNGELKLSYDLPAVLKNRPDLVDGDGTVPQVSAIPIELSKSLKNNFIAEKHAAIQNQKQVLENLREGISLSQFSLDAVRAAQGAISLSLEDLYLADEPIQLRARLMGSAALGNASLTAEITSIADGKAIAVPFVQGEENRWELAIELPAGQYRVAVSTEDEAVATPVHDLFEVLR